MVLVVSVAFAQRPEPSTQIMLDREESCITGLEFTQLKDDEVDLDTIVPGNWDNRTGVARYWWGEAMGFFFGTNLYYDQGYGQQFNVSAPYEIYGALYWLGFAEGTTGNVTFTIWDASGGQPGAVLASTEVPLADIYSSTTFLPDEDAGTPGAFYVDFTDDDGNPLEVTSDYIIGADLTDLSDYVPGEYGLGNMSSLIGDGMNLSWIWEAGGWLRTTVYGYDMDIAIFPVIFMEFDVTFNVDMTGAMVGNNAFDPGTQDVYISGSIVDWAEPGSNEDYKMEPVLPNESQVFYEENFAGGQIPAGWLNIDNDGDGHAWKIVNRPSHNPAVGNYAVKSQSWTQELGAVEPDNWLIMPRKQIAFGDNQLHFQVKAQDPNNAAEKFSVLISTTDDDPGSFSEVHTETLSGSGWQERSLSLADYHGEMIYIAFRHWDSTDNFEILLDNIRIQGIPPLIYSIALANDEINLGAQEYKYFVVEDTPTWDFGEWDGDPNRGIIITGLMSKHDIWGEPVLHDVEFDVVDEAGETIEDAVVTFAGSSNDAGDFDFRSIEGVFEYQVSAEGYAGVSGEIEVLGNHEESVSLALLRTLELVVEDEHGNPVHDLRVGVYVGNTFVEATGESVFSEGFTGTFPPEGWTLEQLGDADGNWEQHPNGFAIHWDHEAYLNNWMITPEIELQEGETYTLSFQDVTLYMDWYGYSAIMVSTGSSEAGHDDWVEIYQPSEDTGGAFVPRELDITDYAGETIRLAFVYEGFFVHVWGLNNISIRSIVTEYVFENLVAGNYNFLVTDYNTDQAYTYTNVYGSVTLPADVENTDHSENVTLESGHWVEFNVDMNNATFDHFGEEVSFNPDRHEVYVTTTIPSWAAPTGWPAFATQGSMVQWPVPGSVNSNRLGYKLTDEDEDGIFTSGLVNIASTGDYEYKYYVVQNEVAGWNHPEFDEEGQNRVVRVKGENVELHDVWGDQPYLVTFNVDISGADSFDHESDVVYITGSFGLVEWAEPGTDPEYQMMERVPGSDIYTITMPVYGGDYEYKYFINDGWTGEEWPGDPNRSVMVTGDLTVDDLFGDITYDTGTSPEITTSVFPNPARERVNVTSTGNIKNIQVFNLTGHKVYDANVDSNSTTVNISGFNQGIYIIRIQTENGFENRKFQVVR